jgi:hypothetical protein
MEIKIFKDVNKNCPAIELYNDNDELLIEIFGENEAGLLVYFHDIIAKRPIPWDEFKIAIKEAILIIEN